MHKTHPDGTHTLVALSSEDHIITASNQNNLDEYYKLLASRYETKRLGKPEKYLGWNFKHFDNGNIGISQPLLIDKLVNAMNLNSSPPAPTPYLSNEYLHPPVEGEAPAPITASRYAEMVGYIRYLADSTRSDICFITSRLACANRHPTLRHFNFLCKLTRYLKGTRNLGLVYTSASGDKQTRLRIYAPSRQMHIDTPKHQLTISSDADFANDITDRKSISGSVITLNHSPITWFSRKKSAVAMFMAESEYRAIASALQGLHIQRLVQSLPMLPAKIHTEGLTDNQPALDMIYSLGRTKLSKFIDIRHRYIQSEVKKKSVSYKHVSLANMKADIMTKPITRHKYHTNRNALFLLDCG